MVLLALKGGLVNRVHAAGLLWPDVVGTRACANLRSVLWRLQRGCCEIVDASFSDLKLVPDVVVDLDVASHVAHRLLDRSLPTDVADLKQALGCNLYEDIAPELGDWEWLEVERERYRQLRLHALEALSEHLITAGWYGAAVDAALGAIQADPFRESAHALLIRAHLCEGNQLEARRRHVGYCDLLRRELDLEPSDQFAQLINGAGARAVPFQARRRPAGAERRRP